MTRVLRSIPARRRRRPAMPPAFASCAAIVALLAVALVQHGCGGGDGADAAPRRASGDGAGAPPPTRITVGTDAAYRPMEYVDLDTQEIVGFDIDLMRAICAEAGLEPEFRNIPWEGLFVAIRTGELDAVISSVTITEERKQSLLFTEPYFVSSQAIVVREADRDAYPTLESLRGKTISVQIGTTGQFLVEEFGGIDVRKFDSAPLALADLRNSNVVAAVIDLPVARFYAQNDPAATVKLVVNEGNLSEEYYGIVVGPKNRRLQRQLDEALARVKEKGIIDQLEEKWF